MLGLHAIGLLLAPVLLWQGWKVRRNTPILPEPTGPRRGVTGSGKLLKLLVIGDSAAAGVGADHQRDALAMQLAQHLGNHYRVEWELLAQTGETTASTLRRLDAGEPITCDVVVTSLGVNDVTSLLGLGAWRRQQARLRDLLQRRYGARRVILSGLPPMGSFPALPQPLRWYLGQRADGFDRVLEADVAAGSGCEFLSLCFTRDMTLAASDGFHPGPWLYTQWASRAAERVHECFNPDNTEARA